MSRLVSLIVNFFRSSVKVKFTALFLLGSLIPMIVIFLFIFGKSCDLLQEKEVESVTSEMNILTSIMNESIADIEKNMTRILLRPDILDEINNFITLHTNIIMQA